MCACVGCDGRSQSSRSRWWRNICSVGSPEAGADGDDGFNQGTEDQGLQQNAKVVQRHCAACGVEPSCMMYGICDFPESSSSSSQPSRSRRKPRACYIPPNTLHGVKIVTDGFEGQLVRLFRRDPVWATDQDPYASHFAKRKRLWELRAQGKFRRIPENEMWIGIVLKDFNYDQAVEKSSIMVKKMGWMFLKYEVYLHWGDRCEASKLPDAELSHLVTNMSGWDQIIVTRKDEHPPDITGELAGLGLERKAEGLKEYTKQVKELFQDVDLETTYTFCFWGVSQLLDVLNWQFVFQQMGMGVKFPMAPFFEEWPIHIVMYELDRSEFTKDDTRHLERRKRYYLDFMLWSNSVSEIAENRHLLSAYNFTGPPGSPEEALSLRDVQASGLDTNGSWGLSGALSRLRRTPEDSVNNLPQASSPGDSCSEAMFSACSSESSRDSLGSDGTNGRRSWASWFTAQRAPLR